jgi:hypothetical protein
MGLGMAEEEQLVRTLTKTRLLPWLLFFFSVWALLQILNEMGDLCKSEREPPLNLAGLDV